MKGRAYVMIFFFWALLTIVTPMLVSWSQSLKSLPQLSNDQGKIKDYSSRRMMRYSEEMHLAREFLKRSEEEEELMMEPSMAPKPELDKPVVPSISFIVRKKQEEGSVSRHANPISLQ